MTPREAFDAQGGNLGVYQDDPDQVVHRELRLRGQGLRFGDVVQLLIDHPEVDDCGGIGIGMDDSRLITVSREFVLSRTPDRNQFIYAKVEDCEHLLGESVIVGRSWRSPLGRTALVGGIVMPDPNIKQALVNYEVHPLRRKSPSIIGRHHTDRFSELMEAGISTSRLRRVNP